MKNKFSLSKRLTTISIACFMIFPFGALLFHSLPKEDSNQAPYLQSKKVEEHRILFDNTHGQTAGAADWVIDGGFSDYADALTGEGYSVSELRKNTEITNKDLEKYDVFILPEANIPYKKSEQEAILHFVKKGGSVFFIADHYNADRNKNRWDASEVFNGYRRGAFKNVAAGMTKEEASSKAMKGVVSSDWLAKNFGVRFRYNALGNLNATKIIEAKECFGITEQIDSVAMHAGSTLAIIDPSMAKGIVYLPEGLSSKDKWASAVDEGVYNGGGVEEGAYVAIAKVGLGKAAFIGDSSAVEDATPKYKKEENGGKKTTYDGFKEEDDARLLVQLTKWLAKKENYKNFAEKGITLDKPTQLHEYETPALSTEPVKEPWATPASGYKWYDQTTFKSGSYRYVPGGATKPQKTEGAIKTEGPKVEPTTNASKEPTQEVTYRIDYPENIVAGEELKLTIHLNQLSANETVSSLKIGSYLSGGTQIALFSMDGSSWSESYGYSEEFSVTADEEGNASKTIWMKIKPGITDTASIRIKRDSANVFTDSITIK